MENGGTGSAIIKSVVLGILGIIVVLGLFLLFTRNKKTPVEDNYQITVVDEITTTNLEKNYPADARKVVDLYAKTMQVLYRENYSNDQQDKMIAVLKGIMDDEFLANNPNMEQSVKNEVKSRKEGNYSISAYVVQGKDPEEVKIGEDKMCSVDCLFSLRQGANGTVANYYQFIMRKDSGGRWKILGWTIKEDE